MGGRGATRNLSSGAGGRVEGVSNTVHNISAKDSLIQKMQDLVGIEIGTYEFKGVVSDWYYNKELRNYDSILVVGETEKAYKVIASKDFVDKASINHTKFMPKSVFKNADEISAERAIANAYTTQRKSVISNIEKAIQERYGATKERIARITADVTAQTPKIISKRENGKWVDYTRTDKEMKEIIKKRIDKEIKNANAFAKKKIGQLYNQPYDELRQTASEYGVKFDLERYGK